VGRANLIAAQQGDLALASLFVIRGNDQGARFELTAPTVPVGRDPSSIVHLHDTEVSRRHAELRRTGDLYTLVDLSSSNGTYVNGQRVTEHALVTADRVQMGGTLMLFTDPGEDSPADLLEQVDIVSRRSAPERSRIVSTIGQDEGNRLFSEFEGSQSPWLARARSNLQIMYRTALAVSHTLDVDQLLQRILELIFEWVEADRGCVMLADAQTKRLEPKARRDRHGREAKDKLSISQTILDYVIEHNEGVLTSDAREDERWDPAASIVQSGVREAICVPMQARYDMVGVIYIDTLTPPERVLERGGRNKFTEDHLKLMIAIAHQAALAVEDTRYYSAMVQAERLAAVGQTIATLSHHVKNILQGIRGGSYLIELGLAEHDESLLRKGWGIVEKNQQRISNLVLDMLTFSKEREPDLVPADLNQVVRDVVELMGSHAAEKSVEVAFQPADEMPRLTFDPDGIHRAVLNVVTNAIDASGGEERGYVTVSTHYAAQEERARVIVTDNGHGIPPEEIEHVFALFVSHKGSRGTGLGLPVSDKIIKEHGGRIVVESEPGRGSRFTIELPAVLAETPPTTSIHQESQST